MKKSTREKKSTKEKSKKERSPSGPSGSFGPAKYSKNRKTDASRNEDKYYTKDEVAEKCVTHLFQQLELLSIMDNNSSNFVWIEPSVGAGAFKKCLLTQDSKSRLLTIDTDSNVEADLHQDFLDFVYLADYHHNANKEKEETIIVFGNPPFGKNSSLAVKFVNKAATFADFVAFILPQSMHFYQKCSQNVALTGRAGQGSSNNYWKINLLCFDCAFLYL